MREQMRRRKGILIQTILVLVLVLSVALQPFMTYAAEQTGSITMSYPVGGVTFSLYKVGEYNHADDWDLYDQFADYSVDLKDTKNAATTLADYVTSDALTADQQTKSKSDGTVSFSGLEAGVYLILGETVCEDGVKYTANPVMLELPQWKDNELIYDVETDSKPSESPEKLTSITVTKIWKNDTEKVRPTSITVQLLKNGKVYKEAELTKDNEWTKTWKKLDGRYTWTVKEKTVPSGYKVGKSVDGTKVALTNTYTTSDNDNNSKKSSTLPQTGQLWWPVGLMAACGLFMILIGLILVRRD